MRRLAQESVAHIKHVRLRQWRREAEGRVPEGWAIRRARARVAGVRWVHRTLVARRESPHDVDRGDFGREGSLTKHLLRNIGRPRNDCGLPSTVRVAPTQAECAQAAKDTAMNATAAGRSTGLARHSQTGHCLWSLRERFTTGGGELGKQRRGWCVRIRQASLSRSTWQTPLPAGRGQTGTRASRQRRARSLQTRRAGHTI